MSKRDIELSARHHKQMEAQKKSTKKLTKIKNALPNDATLATWGAGANTFVQRIKKILED